MSQSEILTGFNNHLIEMIDALIDIIDDNKELKITHASVLTLKKANPKLIIIAWKKYVLDKHEDNIMNGNVNFFLNHDYSTDIQDVENSNLVLDKITIIKNTIKTLDIDNINKTLKFLQNLTKLCKVYYTL